MMHVFSQKWTLFRLLLGSLLLEYKRKFADKIANFDPLPILLRLMLMTSEWMISHLAMVKIKEWSEKLSSRL